MQHLEVSCVVRRFFKSLGFKGLTTMHGQNHIKFKYCSLLSGWLSAVRRISYVHLHNSRW